MRRGRLTFAAVLAVFAVAVTAPPAYAEPDGRIVKVGSDRGSLDLVFQALELPAGAQLDPKRVTLAVDGRSLTATTRLLTDTPGDLNRATMLTIDVSGSMKGERLANAKKAAEAFVRQAPADVLIGVATFASNSRVLVAPTTDRERALTEVRGLVATGDTELYDGVSLSVRSLRDFDVANLVLLSDGKDEGSESALAEVVREVRGSKVLLDVVALDAASAMGALTALARAGNGSVVEAGNESELVRHFRAQAANLTHQVQVTARLPAGTRAGSALVTVTARVGSLTLTDSVEALLSAANTTAADLRAAGPEPAPIELGPFSRPLVASVALLMVFVGLATVLAVAFNVVAATVADSGIRQRLSIYTLGARKLVQETTTTSSLSQHVMTRSAVRLAGKMVAKRGLEEKLGGKLEAGGVRLTPAEWIIIHAGAAVLLPLFLFLLTGGSLVRASIGLLLGALAPYVYLSFRGHRRRRQFFEQLPETLQLMAGSLEAGYSLPQAVDTVAREAEDPMSGELNRAIVETRLGVSVDDALDSVAHRMQCPDFSWVVMAIRIQREVGGNLAELLKTVAATLRDRERLRREVRAVSAEGRLSAWILGALPLAFAGYLILVRPEYLSVMVTNVLGIILSILAALLLLAGILWLRRVVDVEV
jgi:tight adherence protein B